MCKDFTLPNMSDMPDDEWDEEIEKYKDAACKRCKLKKPDLAVSITYKGKTVFLGMEKECEIEKYHGYA